eukprot:7662056-Alexandrium_andersonii.AAC.1
MSQVIEVGSASDGPESPIKPRIRFKGGPAELKAVLEGFVGSPLFVKYPEKMLDAAKPNVIQAHAPMMKALA